MNPELAVRSPKGSIAGCRAAARAWMRWSTGLDIVLMDLHMPVWDGVGRRSD